MPDAKSDSTMSSGLCIINLSYHDVLVAFAKISSSDLQSYYTNITSTLEEYDKKERIWSEILKSLESNYKQLGKTLLRNLGDLQQLMEEFVTEYPVFWMLFHTVAFLLSNNSVAKIKSKVWGKNNIHSAEFNGYCKDAFLAFENISSTWEKMQWSSMPKLRRSLSVGWLKGKAMKQALEAARQKKELLKVAFEFLIYIIEELVIKGWDAEANESVLFFENSKFKSVHKGRREKEDDLATARYLNNIHHCFFGEPAFK